MVLGAIEDAAQPIIGPPGETEQRIRSPDPVETISGLSPGLSAAAPGLSPVFSTADTITDTQRQAEETITDAGGDASSLPTPTDLGVEFTERTAEGALDIGRFLALGQTPGGGNDNEQQRPDTGLSVSGGLLIAAVVVAAGVVLS